MTTDFLPAKHQFPHRAAPQGYLEHRHHRAGQGEAHSRRRNISVPQRTIPIDTPRGIIYTILRKMEGEGLLVSNWDIQESGPARRIYHITKEGLEYLKYAMDRLRRSRQIIMLLLGDET